MLVPNIFGKMRLPQQTSMNSIATHGSSAWLHSKLLTHCVTVTASPLRDQTVKANLTFCEVLPITATDVSRDRTTRSLSSNYIRPVSRVANMAELGRRIRGNVKCESHSSTCFALTMLTYPARMPAHRSISHQQTLHNNVQSRPNLFGYGGESGCA